MNCKDNQKYFQILFYGFMLRLTAQKAFAKHVPRVICRSILRASRTSETMRKSSTGEPISSNSRRALCASAGQSPHTQIENQKPPYDLIVVDHLSFCVFVRARVGTQSEWDLWDECSSQHLIAWDSLGARVRLQLHVFMYKRKCWTKVGMRMDAPLVLESKEYHFGMDVSPHAAALFHAQRNGS